MTGDALVGAGLAAQGWLYTVMPLELVLQGADDPVPELREVRAGGAILLVEMISPTRAKVARLISTDPADYLDPRWQPGAELWLMAAPVEP